MPRPLPQDVLPALLPGLRRGRPLHAAVQAAAAAARRARPPRRGSLGCLLRGRRPCQPHGAQRAGARPAQPIRTATAARGTRRRLHPPRAHPRWPLPAHRARCGATPPKPLRPAHRCVPLPLLRGGVVGSSVWASDLGVAEGTGGTGRPLRLSTPPAVARDVTFSLLHASSGLSANTTLHAALTQDRGLELPLTPPTPAGDKGYP